MSTSPRLPAWKRRLAVAAPPLVVLCVVLVLFDSIQRRRESTRWVEHTQRVIGGLAELRARLADAESGQRGYLITGDPAHLEPYRGAADDARGLLAALREETADDPARQAALDTLVGLVERRFAILERPIEVRRAQGFEAARDTLAAGGGREVMDRIRGVTAAMDREERRLLAAREAAQERHGRIVLLVLFAGAALIAAVALLTNALFRGYGRRQEALNGELSEANDRLREQAAELEMQAEELQAQALQLEEMAVELEAGNDELQALNRELEARTGEAEEANRAKTEFLTAMSHELRTPLNAIVGYVDLVEVGVYGPVSEGQRSSIDRVKHNARHLLALINDILTFARIEAGSIQLQVADLPVRELLAEMDALVGPLVQAKGLAFEGEPCDGSVRVRGDPDRVRQILLNLLSNAIKYTSGGGRLRLSTGVDGEWVRIHVRDTGWGIPADKHEVIFDPFVQLRAAPDGTLSQGVGLGLAISRELARAMGGELAVESAPGAGSTFTLSLRRGVRVEPQSIFEHRADAAHPPPIASGGDASA